MTEISLLSRRVDQLQHQKTKDSELKIVSGRSSFIIKNLQSQIQELEERNVKKDSLIKKLAETILKMPGVSVYQVVESLSSWTVKPSDRRIDFDLESLTSFLQKRKTSVSENNSSSRKISSEDIPAPSISVATFAERIKSRM